MERWKKIAIPGFDYSVSSTGLVRNDKRMRLIKPRIHFGYERFAIQGGGKRLDISGHVLVLLSFVGPRPKGLQASHLNGIKTDNRLENLKWCSVKENNSHKWAHGTQQTGSRCPSSVFLEKDAQNIKLLRSCGYKINYLKTKYGVSRQCIWRVLTGRSWKAA